MYGKLDKSFDMLKLERQMVMLDSSCTELGEQKHYGNNTKPSYNQGNTQHLHYRGVVYKPYCLILMNKWHDMKNFFCEKGFQQSNLYRSTLENFTIYTDSLQ